MKKPPTVPVPKDLQAFPLEVVGERFVVLSYPRSTSGPTVDLTAAERAVLEYVRAGHTNAEIAKLRGTSRQTVANQLRSVFRKLGVGSRVELQRMDHST